VVVISFNAAVIAELKAQAPQYKMYWLLSPVESKCTTCGHFKVYHLGV
jgi:hypothetical protein